MQLDTLQMNDRSAIYEAFFNGIDIANYTLMLSAVAARNVE
jgi:hypothetical protein